MGLGIPEKVKIYTAGELLVPQIAGAPAWVILKNEEKCILIIYCGRKNKMWVHGWKQSRKLYMKKWGVAQLGVHRKGCSTEGC